MRATALAIAGVLAFALSAGASDREKGIESRWLGAWVVTKVEGRSDCLGGYTNNRVNRRLVRGSGSFAFGAGELARVNKIDVKRLRVDVHVSLVEPVLVAHADGPFTLYREAACRLEYQVELDSGSPGRGGIEGTERALERVLERHEYEAFASSTWNRRVRDPYPEDYEWTLARHAAWKAEQTNLVVQTKIDQAVEETTRLRDRVNEDPAYLAGFARGVQVARGGDRGDCAALLALDLGISRKSASPEKSQLPKEPADARGFADGLLLVRGLELIRRLPGCFVPVPELPQEDLSATK